MTIGIDSPGLADRPAPAQHAAPMSTEKVQTPATEAPSFFERTRRTLRYKFDNLMAKGAGAQILLLAVLSAGLILVTAAVITLVPFITAEEGVKQPFLSTAWRLLMRTLDAGNMADDDGSGSFVAAMLFTTLGGIFIVSTLIGVLNNGIEGILENLAKGRSLVIEKGHTVVLGYTPKIHTLLSELSVANENKRDACVVVLADKDKAEMDEEIRGTLEGKRLRVVTRSGSPTSLQDLAIVNLLEAKSVVVLAPEMRDDEPMSPQEADTVVLKTLLAIAKTPRNPDCNIVAEVAQEATLAVARMVSGERAGLVLTPPLISRLLVQTGRQSGLSVVYQELLDFAGAEIYMQEEPKLHGRTFREVVSAYDDSAVMGVLAADDQILLPPAFDYVVRPGDRIIAISEDDDTLVPNAPSTPIDERAIVRTSTVPQRRAERTLLIGASERLPLVLGELDEYGAEGSQAVVIGEDPEGKVALELGALQAGLKNLQVFFQPGEMTDRALLDSLDVGSFDYVMVLSEQEGRDQDVADARTMITLLHLRDIEKKSGKSIQVTSEILDVQNRELATVAEADDFVVSNTLVSLLMSQVSENPHLARVFEDLFKSDGYEVYLKPASEYVEAGSEVDFYTIVEAAARRGEIALGYRIDKLSKSSADAYGVKVNPKKSVRVRYEREDKVVVLAENG